MQLSSDYYARVAEFEQRRRAASNGIARVARESLPTMQVFLSHASVDQNVAEYLGSVIGTAVGAPKVFVASSPGHIRIGDEWLTKIKLELKQADTYLVLLTPMSITRPWIWFETGAAWMSDRRLFPVTALGLAKSAVPLPLGAHQVLSLEDERDARQFFEEMRVAVPDITAFCTAMRAFQSSAVPRISFLDEWEA